jgi:hypothetical protein
MIERESLFLNRVHIKPLKKVPTQQLLAKFTNLLFFHDDTADINIALVIEEIRSIEGIDIRLRIDGISPKLVVQMIRRYLRQKHVKGIYCRALEEEVRIKKVKCGWKKRKSSNGTTHYFSLDKSRITPIVFSS